MIRTSAVTRYQPVCESCGWEGSRTSARNIAEHNLRSHKCGEHREQHDSTGGYRGILGGFNRYCVCGAHYVSDSAEPFACPKAATPESETNR